MIKVVPKIQKRSVVPVRAGIGLALMGTGWSNEPGQGITKKEIERMQRRYIPRNSYKMCYPPPQYLGETGSNILQKERAYDSASSKYL